MRYELNPIFSHAKPLLEDIDFYFQQSDNILYDQRNQIRVVSFEGTDYVVKSFKPPNFINRIVYRYFRPSKAKRSYHYSLKIGKEFCPPPIGYIEEHKRTLLEKSYYISCLYEYDFTIRPVLLDKDFDKSVRKQVLEELADFTYSLHEKGILHRDYSYGNILIKKVGGHYQFRIIDVNRMQFKELDLNDRLENFSRLSADDEAMKIIISRYAYLTKMPVNELLAVANRYRDEFTRKKLLKKKLRGK